MDSVARAGFGSEAPKQLGRRRDCHARPDPFRVEAARNDRPEGGFGAEAPKHRGLFWPLALFLAFAAVLAAGRGARAEAPKPVGEPLCGLPSRSNTQVIAAADFVAAGEKAVREQVGAAADDEVTISAVMVPHSLLGPVGQVTLDAAVRRPALPGGLWVAEVTARSGDWSAKTTIRYRVRIATSVLVTRRAVKRNEVLTQADVSIEKRELGGLRGEPIREIAELLGRRVARPVSAGTVVTADWLEPAPAVRRTEVVTALARIGGVSASTRVIALRDGKVGEVIPVRSQVEVFGSASPLKYRSNEFEARIVGPGRVEVMSP